MKKFVNTNFQTIYHATSALKTPDPEYLVDQIYAAFNKQQVDFYFEIF